MGTNRSNSHDNAGIGQALGLSIVITLGGSAATGWLLTHPVFTNGIMGTLRPLI